MARYRSEGDSAGNRGLCPFDFYLEARAHCRQGSDQGVGLCLSIFNYCKQSNSCRLAEYVDRCGRPLCRPHDLAVLDHRKAKCRCDAKHIHSRLGGHTGYRTTLRCDVARGRRQLPRNAQAHAEESIHFPTRKRFLLVGSPIVAFRRRALRRDVVFGLQANRPTLESPCAHRGRLLRPLTRPRNDKGG